MRQHDGFPRANGATPDAARAPRRSARPVVIKIGGRALEAPGAPEQLATEIAALDRPAVVVHGGGREVSEWCARLAIEPRFVDGLRVTDDATLEVAVAVLGGLANRRLVALLRQAGVDAVGLAALDGGIAACELHPQAGDLGHVGVVREVRPALLATLLAAGRTPVLASVGERHGRLLNLNADELAAALAGSLRAATLVLLSDAPGVVLDGRVAPAIAVGELAALRARPDVKDGMVAKLHAVEKAIGAGAARVRIASWEGPGSLAALLGERPFGTTIEARDPSLASARASARTPSPRTS